METAENNRFLVVSAAQLQEYVLMREKARDSEEREIEGDMSHWSTYYCLHTLPIGSFIFSFAWFHVVQRGYMSGRCMYAHIYR